MKKLFFLLAAFAAAPSVAQPVIQSSHYYPAGTILNFEIASITNVQPGPSGVNQTWNFSNLNLTGESYTYHYLPAASTPYSNLFPSSNLGIEIKDNTNGDTTYMYQTKTNQAVSYDGNAGSDGGNTAAFINTNPQTIFEFPVGYNSTGSDYISGQMTISGGGMTMEIHRYGPQTMIADGYGTLQLPGATFNNCLRLKYRQILTDSTLFTGVPFPATLSTDIKTMYTWIQIVNGVAVERLTMTYDTITDNNGQQFETFCQINRSTTTGLHSEITDENSITVYPNPAHDFLFLSFDELNQENFHVELLDPTGRTIRRFLFTGTESTTEKSIHLKELPPGMYLIRLITERGIITKKFLHY